MINTKKTKKPRVQSVIMEVCRGKVGTYWWPIPFDKKYRFIPSSVDCLYSQEYFNEQEAINMMRSL